MVARIRVEDHYIIDQITVDDDKELFADKVHIMIEQRALHQQKIMELTMKIQELEK